MIIRARKDSENPYAQISRKMLGDKTLSWKAKGIFSYILSNKDDWKFYLSELQSHSIDGRDSLSSGIKELEDKGYIKRERERDKGMFVGWIWNIIETPITDKPITDKPITDKPITDKPITDKPITVNPQLISNNINNININENNNNENNTNKEDDFFGFGESVQSKEDNVPEEFINLTKKHYERQLQLTPKSTSKKERLNNINVLNDAKDLYKVSLKFDYDIKILTGMLDYSIKHEFWQDKTTILNYSSLMKKWANGIKIEMLYEQYVKSNNFKTNVYQDKADSTDENAVYEL